MKMYRDGICKIKKQKNAFEPAKGPVLSVLVVLGVDGEL